MGAVYRARQPSLDRRVALKVISPELGADSSYRRLFEQEARHAAAIEHPNVLPVYGAGEGPGGALFLSMRLIRGHDLGRHLLRRGPLPPRDAVTLLIGVAAALDTAHKAGLIHRDVKPGNVLLEPREEGMHVYLADFGLAQRLGRGTEAERVLGTVDYMPPEQLEGRAIDQTADVYAFGCLLYRCLVGEAPFHRATPAETKVAHLNAPVPRPSDSVSGIPEALDLLVLRALEKDPARRAQSVSSLMRHAASELEVNPPPSPRTGRARRPAQTSPTATGPPSLTDRTRQRWPIAALVTLSFLLLAGVGAALLVSRGSEPQVSSATGDRAVNVLELTADGVRVSALLGASIQQLAKDPSGATREEVERDLTLASSSISMLRRLAESRLAASDPARIRLRRAADEAGVTGRGLQEVAADPTAPGGALAMRRVRRGYTTLLGELRETVRGLERDLSAGSRLNATDARAIESIEDGIAEADEQAGVALDRLDTLVASGS